MASDERQGPSSRELAADVLVIGGGTTGIVAAVAAARQGRRVIVIEKNNYVGGEGLISACTANFGGGTDFQRAAGVVDSREAFYADMRRFDPRADDAVLRMFCDTAVETCHFLRDLGVEWTLAPHASTADMGMNVLRGHMVVGKGPALYGALVPALERAGGTILTGTRALALLQDDHGGVTGVRARDAAGTLRISAGATLLCCGGFEGNVELVTRYVSPDANYALLRGLPTNSGDGLLMGLEVGAGTRAMHRIHGYLHLPPDPVPYPLHPFTLIPRDGTAALPPYVQEFPYWLLVNARGQRFVDETAPRIGEQVCNALVRQPGAVGFAIMDQTIFATHWQSLVATTSAFWQGLGLGAVRVATADSPAELARQLDFNPAGFAAMIAEYNQAVADGTTHLLTVPKSNREPLGYYEAQGTDYLHRIVSPPFHAVQVIAGFSHTAGGLSIDGACRVLDRDGDAIEGLFAGGDTSVLWHANYGSAFARALITGYVAGHAMAERTKPGSSPGHSTIGAASAGLHRTSPVRAGPPTVLS